MILIFSLSPRFCTSIILILVSPLLFNRAGLQRAVSVLAVAGQHQEPEAVAIATQSHAQNLPHSVQSAGRSRAAGRLLSESGRLVGAERARRRSRQLRVFVERVHQSSKCCFFWVFCRCCCDIIHTILRTRFISLRNRVAKKERVGMYVGLRLISHTNCVHFSNEPPSVINSSTTCLISHIYIPVHR